LKKLLNAYRFLNVLSIDVALGAICSSCWLANYFKVDLRIYSYLALGLTVWVIYTVDHLIDAKHIGHQASSKRHQFHQRNFNVLAVITSIFIGIDGVLVFFVRESIFYAGVALSLIITVYLLFNRWLTYLKEFVVAVLYCGGVILPVVSITGTEAVLQQVDLLVSFFLTALINVVLFSWFDWKIDQRDSGTSIVLSLGIDVVAKVLWILFLVQGALILWIGTHTFVDSVLLGFMNGILLLLFVQAQAFTNDERFRLLGDAIFLLPVFTFLFR
jgi:hypothetical protein